MANGDNRQPWQGQGMTRAQAAQMIRLQQRANRQHGCLMAVVWTLLFGVFYWAWLGIKWTAKGALALARAGWALVVVYPVQWTIALTRWTIRATHAAWPVVARATRGFHARYGAKGWAAVGAAVLVLAALGAVVGGR